MKVAVTGGAGFIGSNLVDSLVERGHDVIVIDNLATGKRSYLNPAAPLFEIDVATDSEGLTSALHGRLREDPASRAEFLALAKGRP